MILFPGVPGVALLIVGLMYYIEFAPLKTPSQVLGVNLADLLPPDVEQGATEIIQSEVKKAKKIAFAFTAVGVV